MHLDIDEAKAAADAIADDPDNKNRWLMGAVVQEWRNGVRNESGNHRAVVYDRGLEECPACGERWLDWDLVVGRPQPGE